MQDGMTRINEGAHSFGTGLSTLNTGYGQLAAGIGPLSNDSKKLTDAMEGYGTDHPELTDDPAYQKMVQISEKLNGGLDSLNTNFSTLDQGINKTAQRVESFETGTETILSKLEDLSNGANQIASAQSKISSGTTDLYNGWTSVIDHLETLKNGEDKLAAGSAELTDQLAKGAKEIQDIHTGQPIYEMMSNPVRLKEQLAHNIPNYGTGLAPYFLSLSLFVGALLISTVLPLRATFIKPPSGIAWFLSKFVLLAFISLFHSIITNLFLIYLVGLDPINKGYLYLFTFFVSLMFMSIILLLVITLDNAGRFLAIILLVLQLTSSAGTFPIELTPKFFQTLHSLLPMTYTVQGFRTIISTGDYHLLQSDVIALAVYLIAAVLLTLIILNVLVKKPVEPEKA